MLTTAATRHVHGHHVHAASVVLQVPSSLLLLNVEGSTPELIAAGAVEVQLTSQSGSKPTCQKPHVVILRNQEQQPVACAEVYVCLSTPYVFGSTGTSSAPAKSSNSAVLQECCLQQPLQDK